MMATDPKKEKTIAKIRPIPSPINAMLTKLELRIGMVAVIISPLSRDGNNKQIKMNEITVMKMDQAFLNFPFKNQIKNDPKKGVKTLKSRYVVYMH